MVFWLTIIIFLVAIVFAILANYEFWECACVISATVAVLSFIVALVMLVVICINHSGTSAKQAQTTEQYKAMLYKLESDACRDEFGLLNKEIIDEIQEWNENISFYKNAQNDVWIGIFYPDIYEEFEVIALE